MVDFAGWSMPVQYRSILDEHRATRERATLFDVSHMGRLRFDGPRASAWLDSLLTRAVTNLPTGGVRYSLMANHEGEILDDVLVYSFPPAPEAGEPEPFHLLVVNASNRDTIVSHIAELETAAADACCPCRDLTRETAMIAVQGPLAVECAEPLLSVSLSELKYYRCTPATICGHAGLVSRTGYTGEDGCELVVPAAAAEEVWTALESRPQAPIAAGLGARDTLRLEAGMPLYGHELSRQISPYETGLNFAVNLEGREFVGADALRQQASTPPTRARVGLQLHGKRIAREQTPVLHHDAPVGRVTSGTFSPTLECPIAMALVDLEASKIGAEVEVEIRGKREPAVVAPLPFYKR